MTTYDQTTAECTVLTFKEGLLSRVAHDLKLRAARFRIEVDDDTHAIHATFAADSLRVVCQMKDGAEHGVPSDKDRRDIERNITRDVLRPRKHPEVRFESTGVEPAGDGYAIRGTLSLHGRERAIATTATRDGDRLRVEVRLHQPDFGIKPFSAMLGAIKVRPEIVVQVSVPA